jgi:uncharacterized protein (TIGR02284 family)
MTERTTEITTLNTLINTLMDSIEGYTKSAEDIHNPQLRERFLSRARERQQAVGGLQAAVARMGGDPADDTSTLGEAHRFFMNIKEAVTGTDDTAILQEVDRGESYLKEKFETALRSTDLSPEARTAVDQAWSTVKAGHEEMAALKHRREGAEDYAARQTDATTSARQQEYASESDRAGSTGGTFSGSDESSRRDDPLI